jgi:3-oxoacyl-[acyl-carrier protein] reductase
MELDLSNKVVVVTGAARGIGRVIAETFAREGATTIALDVSAVDLAEDGSPVHGVIPCDVTDLDRVTTVFREIVERHGRIDVLINNAGINAEGLVEDIDPGLWDRAFDVNTKGTFNTCRAVIPVMRSQGGGRIINAASFAAIIPSVGAAAYGASKAAVVQFTRTLASEVGPYGITANAYAPGMIPTAMNGFADMPEDEQSRRLDMLSVRRWGEAEDVAQLLLFLASDLSSYITGTLVDVSGGKFSTQEPSRAYTAAGDR